MVLIAKDLSKNITSEQVTNAFVIGRPYDPTKLVCSPKQTSQLLKKLRKTYRALALRDRKQVKAFIRECQRVESTKDFRVASDLLNHGSGSGH